MASFLTTNEGHNFAIREEKEDFEVSFSLEGKTSLYVRVARIREKQQFYFFSATERSVGPEAKREERSQMKSSRSPLSSLKGRTGGGGGEKIETDLEWRLFLLSLSLSLSLSEASTDLDSWKRRRGRTAPGGRERELCISRKASTGFSLFPFLSSLVSRC